MNLRDTAPQELIDEITAYLCAVEPFRALGCGLAGCRKPYSPAATVAQPSVVIVHRAH